LSSDLGGTGEYFAPAATHARSTATSSGCRSDFGGIFGFARPSTCRMNGLSSGWPAMMAAPESPPRIRSS
jgi:hypothetical protein